MRGDLPRFFIDFYEGCRGTSRLFLLDKYIFFLYFMLKYLTVFTLKVKSHIQKLIKFLLRAQNIIPLQPYIFDVLRAGACLKCCTDPLFFGVETSSSKTTKAYMFRGKRGHAKLM